MNFKNSNGCLKEHDEENVVCTKLNALTFDDTYDNEAKTSDDVIDGNDINITTDENIKTEGLEPTPGNGIRKTDESISKPGEESPMKNYHLYGRSMSLSIENGYERKSILHSIIKERKGESAYFYDREDEEDITGSTNSLNEESDQNDSPPPTGEPKLGRRRIKSVTFNDEPTIFEFAKLTKRQFKKQQKEERQQKLRESKGIFSKRTPSEDPEATIDEEETGAEQTSKKTKKKNKYEKKGRSYSDGLLQVPNSFLARHKKKNKNKKNKDDDIEKSPTNSFSDLTECPEETSTQSETTGELLDTNESDFRTGEALI